MLYWITKHLKRNTSNYEQCNLADTSQSIAILSTKVTIFDPHIEGHLGQCHCSNSCLQQWADVRMYENCKEKLTSGTAKADITCVFFFFKIRPIRTTLCHKSTDVYSNSTHSVRGLEEDKVQRTHFQLPDSAVRRLLGHPLDLPCLSRSRITLVESSSVAIEIEISFRDLGLLPWNLDKIQGQ
jgi:hypothetical protein